MSDPTANGPQDDQPQQQPPAYPPPQQNPYGQPPPQSAPQQPAQEPAQPFGQPQYGQPPQDYGQPAYGQAPAYGQGARDPAKRPTTVTVAGVVTLVLSGLVLVLLLLGLVALAVARDEVVTEMRRQSAELGDIDPNDVVSVVFVVFGAFILWCIAAMVLAVFAMRRSNGARIGLVVSAALSAVLSLIAVTSGVSAITLIGSIAVIGCLFAGGASQWYQGKSGSSDPSSGIRPPVA